MRGHRFRKGFTIIYVFAETKCGCQSPLSEICGMMRPSLSAQLFSACAGVCVQTRCNQGSNRRKYFRQNNGKKTKS